MIAKWGLERCSGSSGGPLSRLRPRNDCFTGAGKKETSAIPRSSALRAVSGVHHLDGGMNSKGRETTEIERSCAPCRRKKMARPTHHDSCRSVMRRAEAAFFRLGGRGGRKCLAVASGVEKSVLTRKTRLGVKAGKGILFF